MNPQIAGKEVSHERQAEATEGRLRVWEAATGAGGERQAGQAEGGEVVRWHPHDVVAGKLAPFLGPCTAQTVRCSNARDLGSKTNPCCLSHIYHIFAEMDRILADAGILWWLDYGSALGALRDGKVIPHDKDGDAGLLGDQWPAFLALEDRVLAAGLHWWHKPNAHRGRFSGGHMVKIRLSPRNHTNVDFFPWYPNGKGELDRQSYIGIDRFKGREFPAAWVGATKRVPFGPLLLPVAEQDEALVVHRYGINWRRPLNTNNDGVRR